MKNRTEIIHRIILYAVAFIVLCQLGWTIRQQYSGKEIAYIDIGRLVDNYKLKKDLEASASQDLYKIKGAIDSLGMIKKAAAYGSVSPVVDSQIAYAEYTFQRYYSESNQQISKKVWDRLNPVIEEYGKDRGIELLVGANGAGTVLYGAEARDLTDDLIRFVNVKYEKGN